jgi:hypothetical protein
MPENSSLLVPSRLLFKSLLCSTSAAICNDGSLAPLQEADAPRERERERKKGREVKIERGGGRERGREKEKGRER